MIGHVADEDTVSLTDVRVPRSVADAEVVAAASNRFAYVWANQPLAASYTPSTAYSYNGKGGANTITRTGVGAYTVRFGLMAKGFIFPLNRETILVTAYGGGARRCVIMSWGDAANDLDVRVQCADVVGNPLDSRFTVLLVANGALPGRSGFAWANQPASALYIPSASYAYTSANDTIKIRRFAVGNYNVDLRLPRPIGGLPENYFVTAYGSPRTLCKVGSWGSTASVLCYVTTAAPIDVRYDVLLVEQGRPGRRLGFAWADQPSSAAYFPSASYRRNTSGGSIHITRSAMGTYAVLFRVLQKLPGATETVQVSSYGAGFSSCIVVSWGNVAPTDLRVNVECRNNAGALADSRYQVMVIE
ncbi:MAG: hypothetical protein ACT4P7_05920 [Gemmatimonadaceae bacterium]